jgi:hypothetical protein
MGANRAGDNLRRKRKRHVKNLVTAMAAAEKREKGSAKAPRARKGAAK